MKIKMKKVLALLLTLSLVLVSFGDFAQVKAAGYTNVTLTGTDGWSTSVTSDSLILYLTTSGYTSSDWSYKYKGFTYEYNGVTGTTTQVSSADGSRLYCTIPTSAVPATDGTTFTIKAGQYDPDDSGTATGLNITNDLQIVVSEGRLVHTTVVEPTTVEAFNSTANSFYFAVKDANGNAISTGVESWTNFLSPSWCDGTRVTQDAVANQWSLVYSGVFIDGSPMNYWDAHFKNTDPGTFYIDGLSATAGTTVTVRGHFVSSTQANWTMVGNFYLPELTFTYDGSAWNYTRSIEYTDVTLTETNGWSTCVEGDHWVLQLKTNGYTSTDASKTYNGFTYEINGVTKTTSQITSAAGNILCCTIPISDVPAENGTTFTIKAGDCAPVTGYEGLRITEDFDIVAVDSRLVHTTVVKPATVETGAHSAESFHFYLKDADGNEISTGVEDWVSFLSPAHCDGTRIDTAGWISTYSSVYIGDTMMDYWGAHFKNTGNGEFYIDGLSAVAGTTVTVKGLFASSTQADWTLRGHFYLPELTFTYDGSEWSHVEGSSYTEYTGKPVFDHSSNIKGFYFKAGETAFPYDLDWGYTSYAEDNATSGVFITSNGVETKTSVYLKKVQEDLWYVCLNDKNVVPATGDIITVKGSFIYDDAHRMTFSEAKFIWDGSQYKTYVESTNYTGTPVLAENEEYGKAAGFYFTSEDGAPYAGDWSLDFTALDGDANGVFVNDTKTAIILKKVGTNLWYVCIGDANVTLNYGDVVTIKGTFQVGDTSDTVTFNEASFEFNGKRFGEGEFTATDFTITGLAYSDIVYDTANSRWNMYFTLSTNIPGDVDATYYPYMSYEIDGTEYKAHWYKSSSAHMVKGETIYNLYVPITQLPQPLDKEYVITLKAGASQGRVSGTNVAREDGIRLTEDYQFTVGGDYEASAPTIDYLSANGGNANGIYLSSQDLFPTIGWDYNLTKVAADDGIYIYNAETGEFDATDIFIKKHEDNKYYVCLSDMGIAAQEGTIVMIRGAFTTAGLNTVTFQTAKYVYKNGQWQVYSTTVEIDSTGVDGDATGDEKLNSADLIRIKRYLKGLKDEIGVVDADLNGTGYVDEKDVVLQRKLLIGLIDENGAHIKGAPTYDNTTDEMRLAAYVSPTKDGFADYKAAGFTTLISEHIAVYGEDGFDAYMKAAEEQGLDVIVQSGYMQNMLTGQESVNQAWLEHMYSEVSAYDSFRGLFMGDEPRINQLSSYTSVVNVLKTIDPDIELFTSCLQTYTDEEYLSTDSSLSLAQKYVGYANAYGNLFGEFTYDFYPFKHSYKLFLGMKYDEKDYMRPDWFNNLTLVASNAKGSYDTGITVQSYAENLNAKDHYREVTRADISFQVYSALAYGMKSINYFTYGTHWDESVGTTSCMVYNGNKTTVYDAVKNVNSEIKALDHMLLNYTWQGTVGIKGTNSDTIMNYVTSYTSKRISAYSASNDAIIGCLRDVDGYDGFMLVNATDPSDNITETISVTFNSADHAKVYINGEESIVELTNGTYETTLAPGQGVFVIPYIQ